MGDIEDIGADDLRHFFQNGGQTLGVIRLVNIRDVFLLGGFARRVANIVDIEAKRLGEVVEALEPELFQLPDRIQFTCTPFGPRSRVRVKPYYRTSPVRINKFFEFFHAMLVIMRTASRYAASAASSTRAGAARPCIRTRRSDDTGSSSSLRPSSTSAAPAGSLHTSAISQPAASAACARSTMSPAPLAPS